MAKHKDTQLNLRGGRYPIAELMHITITKPVDQFTTWEHLLVGKLLEELARVKRQSGLATA